MSTPRVDEKDKSLVGNYLVCYGVMLEFARGLERELEAAGRDRDSVANFLDQARADLQDAKVKLDLQASALGFYANPANWLTASAGFLAQYDPAPSPAQSDRGFKARVALGMPATIVDSVPCSASEVNK
jgi:hypothetical protein